MASLFLALGQANISGNASLSLIDGGTDCQGGVRLVEVHADVSGLSGDGGLAGINAFVLKFNVNNGNLFSIARRATNPISFDIVHTEKSLVGSQNTVIVSGWSADSNAPNGSYHLLTLQFAGVDNTISITIDETESNLASRVASGFGPDAIGFTVPPEATFSVPAPVSFPVGQALLFWLGELAFYDLVPDGTINMLDYAKLIICRE